MMSRGLTRGNVTHSGLTGESKVLHVLEMIDKRRCPGMTDKGRCLEMMEGKR